MRRLAELLACAGRIDMPRQRFEQLPQVACPLGLLPHQHPRHRSQLLAEEDLELGQDLGVVGGPSGSGLA